MPIDPSEFKSIGEDVTFDELVSIRSPELITIGDDVQFQRGVIANPAGTYIDIGSHTHFAHYSVLYGPLTIGTHCAVAAHVVFASIGHGYARTDIPMIEQPVMKKKIVLEDDVWIGANAVIIQGVTVGTGSIVGAGAVVTKDVPPYTVVGGTPASVIRSRT